MQSCLLGILLDEGEAKTHIILNARKTVIRFYKKSANMSQRTEVGMISFTLKY